MDLFKLEGTYASGPSQGSPSGGQEILAPLDELFYLRTPGIPGEYSLSADSPVAVGFGALASAGVVIIKATGGKVRVRLTSADGSQQAIPVDTLLVLLARTVPVTAIDLTRVTGIVTTVKVFLGETA